jgi:hypothetical protein
MGSESPGCMRVLFCSDWTMNPHFLASSFGTSPKPVWFFFSLEVSHSENHRRPFQDQCIYPPLDSCQSMYHTYDIYDFTIKFEDFIEFTTLFEPKKPAVVGFNRPSQAKHLQLPAQSGKTPSPQRSGTSPPSPQQDNKKWQPWTMAKDRHNLC